MHQAKLWHWSSGSEPVEVGKNNSTKIELPRRRLAQLKVFSVASLNRGIKPFPLSRYQWSLDRIVSTRMKRVTTEQSTNSHAAAAPGAVARDRINSVFRTCGNESARRG